MVFGGAIFLLCVALVVGAVLFLLEIRLTLGVLVVFFVFGFLVFRRACACGSIWFWTILLIIAAIVAPLIGEIGTPIGI